MKNISKRQIIVVLAVAVALLLGLLGGLVLLPLVSSNGSEAVASANGASPTGTAEHNGESKAEPGMMYAMAERVVNLSDPGGYRYLKIEVALEFALPEAKGLKGEAYKKRQDEFVKEMASRRPKMDDILITVLTSKNSVLLSSAEGKEKLREELKQKMDEVAGEHRIINVYFTQFIIQ